MWVYAQSSVLQDAFKPYQHSIYVWQQNVEPLLVLGELTQIVGGGGGGLLREFQVQAWPSGNTAMVDTSLCQL
jgi:hypothetical protein